MSYCSAFALFGKLNGLTRQSSRLSRSRRSVRFVPSSCSTRQEVHGDNAACLSSSICIVRISSYRQMGVSEAIEGVQEVCIEWRRRQERTQTPRSNRRHITYARPSNREKRNSEQKARSCGAVTPAGIPDSDVCFVSFREAIPIVVWTPFDEKIVVEGDVLVKNTRELFCR